MDLYVDTRRLTCRGLGPPQPFRPAARGHFHREPGGLSMYRACKQKERKEATSGSVDDSVTSILLQDSPQTTPELVHVSVLQQHCIQQFLDSVGSRLHYSTSSYSFFRIVQQGTGIRRVIRQAERSDNLRGFDRSTLLQLC